MTRKLGYGVYFYAMCDAVAARVNAARRKRRFHFGRK